MAAVRDQEAVLASEADVLALKKLEAVLSERPGIEIALELIAPSGDRLELPASLTRLLARLVQDLARGRAVVVTSIDADLTTQQAADILNVSRPFLVKLLETGEIPFHMVGSHRRVALQDLLAYRSRRSQKRQEFFARAAQEAQDMGIYE